MSDQGSDGGSDAGSDGEDRYSVIGGFDDLADAASLGGLFALDGTGTCYSNRRSLLNVGGPMLGGHIAALGMKAAALTAPGTLPGAIHVLFLTSPDASLPCDLQVEPVRDGRRLTHRMSGIAQAGRRCAQVTTTLAAPALERQGPTYRRAAPPPVVPAPESLASRSELAASFPAGTATIDRQVMAGHPFLDIRFVPAAPSDGGRACFWVRVPRAGPLAALDQLCMLTLISDYWCTLPVHQLAGARDEMGHDLITTSLDHALWFHAAPDCSEWMLFEMSAGPVGGGTAIMQASAWSREGRPLATVMQRALLIAEDAKPRGQ